MKKGIALAGLVLILCLADSSVLQAKVLVNKKKAGKNATWTLTDDGVMTVEGKGEVEIGGDMYIKYWKDVKKIVIEDGINCISMVSGFCNAISIQLPRTIKQIDVCGLSSNEAVTELIIPSKVETIGREAFTSCKSLKTIKLSKNLKTIGAQAFKKCKSLKSLTIPNGVTSIGKGAFDDCNSLETLVLPKKLKTFQADFSKTKCLKKVVNKSKKWIPLDTCGGKRVWKVNGKKVTRLAPGKTAVTKGVRYQLTYSLSGGKAQGKLPKYYYYGNTPKLPKVKKKGYDFIGWYDLQYGDGYIPEKFPSKSGKNLKLTAMLVQVKVKRISETEAEFCVKDSVSWGSIDEPGEEICIPQYYIRVYTERPTKPYRDWPRDYKAADYGAMFRGGKRKFSELDPNKKYYYEVSFHWLIKEADDFESDGNLCGWHLGYELPEYKK